MVNGSNEQFFSIKRKTVRYILFFSILTFQSRYLGFQSLYLPGIKHHTTNFIFFKTSHCEFSYKSSVKHTTDESRFMLNLKTLTQSSGEQEGVNTVLVASASGCNPNHLKVVRTSFQQNKTQRHQILHYACINGKTRQKITSLQF